MGSGKTTVGRLLAERLHRPFFDSDEMVEARTGRTVREIFETDGEAAYRPLETDALLDALGVARAGGDRRRRRGGAVAREPGGAEGPGRPRWCGCGRRRCCSSTGRCARTTGRCSSSDPTAHAGPHGRRSHAALRRGGRPRSSTSTACTPDAGAPTPGRWRRDPRRRGPRRRRRARACSARCCRPACAGSPSSPRTACPCVEVPRRRTRCSPSGGARSTRRCATDRGPVPPLRRAGLTRADCVRRPSAAAW